MDNELWLELLTGANTVFVLFSGGKDSAAALAFTKECLLTNGDETKLVALHVDTTVGLPQTEEFVKDFCRTVSISLEILRPKEDYFSLAKRWGVPRPRARWCCFHLKIEPLKNYLRHCSDFVVVDGMRREESRKRRAYPFVYQHPHFGCVVHPIIDWTAEEVDNFLRDRRLPINPAYELGFSSWECWCGVYKRKEEFVALKKTNPDFFMKLVELESQLASGFAYAFCDHKPLYLRDLLNEEDPSLAIPYERGDSKW